MSGVLLMSCAGPMQSWGTRSRFEIRDTEREPSKSGVVGLIASALGRDRKDSVVDLASLRMGVRVDQEGILKKDFQTVQQVAVASGGTPSNLISTRYYLADAVFLVGLEGGLDLLTQISHALKKPRRPLFFGRKSFVPSRPVFLPDGLIPSAQLAATLESYPPLISFPGKNGQRGDSERRVFRFILETNYVTPNKRRDQPLSFDINDRQYQDRYVKIYRSVIQPKGGI